MAGGFGRRPFHFPRQSIPGQSTGHGVSKAARSHRREPAKDVGEMALIGEPNSAGYLADGEIRVGQQSFRALDTCPQDILTRRDTYGLAELPVEVETTHPGNIRQIIETDGAAEPGIDVRHHASQ